MGRLTLVVELKLVYVQTKVGGVCDIGTELVWCESIVAEERNSLLTTLKPFQSQDNFVRKTFLFCENFLVIIKFNLSS